MTQQPLTRPSSPTEAINTRLIHRFYGDLSARELSLLRAGLDKVPGTEEGRARLWEKFQANQAGLFVGRSYPDGPQGEGELAFFTFFEVRTRQPSSAREFFLCAAAALQPSRGLVAACFPQFEYFAGVLQCQSMAVRTPRPGLMALLLKQGWFLDRRDEVSGEWLLRKRLGEVKL